MSASNPPPAPADATAQGQPQQGNQDEPEIAQEEDIPLDGKDEVGEKMMEGLGRDQAEARRDADGSSSSSSNSSSNKG